MSIIIWYAAAAVDLCTSASREIVEGIIGATTQKRQYSRLKIIVLEHRILIFVFDYHKCIFEFPLHACFMLQLYYSCLNKGDPLAVLAVVACQSGSSAPNPANPVQHC